MSATEARQFLQRLIDEAVAIRSDRFLLVESNYKIKELAGIARDNFGGDSRAQMKKLERVALGARTFGEVIDYVRYQTGRTTRAGEQWRKGDFGKRLHDVLWEVANNITDSAGRDLFKAFSKTTQKELEELGYTEENVKRDLRLRLTRAYVRHLVAYFTFLEKTS